MPFPRAIDHLNLSKPELIEHAIKKGEGFLSEVGSLMVSTKKYTGRSPESKFMVCSDDIAAQIWWSENNHRYESNFAQTLYEDVEKYLKEEPCYVIDARVGARPEQSLKVRVICERAWHALFAKTMFLPSDPHDEKIDFTIFHAPGFFANKEIHKTSSEAAVVTDILNNRVVICGTEYAGEIKKSMFGVLNFLLPQRGILGMHCAASSKKDEDVALFFGLSGTGKTALSANIDRSLIGDDEHAWDDLGIFNYEAGCYAKVIKLSPDDEPLIFQAINNFGVILENVTFNKESRAPNYFDNSITENTRASYDLSFIKNSKKDGTGPHPKNVILLTCDAFSILPPIAKLDHGSAVYHFLSGYTAKVSGTELGISKPKAVFSPCYGAPFMPLKPLVYANLFLKKLKKHNPNCFLLNTGWTAGPFGIGKRIPIKISRILLEIALNGNLDNEDFYLEERFKFLVPKMVSGIDADIFFPKKTWADEQAYDAQAKELAILFHENMKPYFPYLTDEILSKAPNI